MKLLMVCLGNICRSPLAHGIMAHLIKENNLAWTVESAGTGDWHIGQQPDKRAIAVAKQYGVDISAQRARHFNASFFEQYDHVFVMDESNYNDVLALALEDDHQEKVKMFLSEGPVPDPYFDGNMFDPVYQMIEKRCRELLAELK